MNHIQPSEIWPQIKDVWVMCSLSKLRVSHTVIPYSFPCCIPLSEIGMDLSSGLFCAGCQRSDNGINRIPGWSVAGTNVWRVGDWWRFCDGFVMVLWRFGDGLVTVKTWYSCLDSETERKYVLVTVVTVFFQFSPRACACVRTRVY